MSQTNRGNRIPPEQRLIAEQAAELEEHGFARATYVGIGVMGQAWDSALRIQRPGFVEVWWPGYVRQRMAARVRFVVPDTIDTWPIIGETRINTRGRVEVRITTAVRIDRHGEIKGVAEFPFTRWLEAGSALNIDFSAASKDS